MGFNVNCDLVIDYCLESGKCITNPKRDITIPKRDLRRSPKINLVKEPGK